jgi:hypothetical protein
MRSRRGQDKELFFVDCQAKYCIMIHALGIRPRPFGERCVISLCDAATLGFNISTELSKL